MKTILVWYLVSWGYGIHWSPPMPTLQECERARQVLKDRGSYSHLCIQINEVLK